MSADHFPDATKKVPAVGALLDPGVGRLEPEREAFERWCADNGHGTLDDMMMPMDRALKNLLWTAWQAADARWQDALRQTWQMVDPLKPAGTPGSYARGQDSGIVAALTTLRANLKTPNVRANLPARACGDWPRKDNDGQGL